MIEVRDATIDDADALASAHIDGWRVGYRGVVPDEYLDAEEFASSRRERWQAWSWQSWQPQSRMFAVTIHGRVVGFGHAGPEITKTAPTGRGEVFGFYLHPTAWGSGAAGALMSRCEEYLRDEGFTSAVLWVMRDNPRGVAFYEKVGWRFTGEESVFTPTERPGSTLPRIAYPIREYEVRL